jgi:hypothetical protein
MVGSLPLGAGWGRGAPGSFATQVIGGIVKGAGVRLALGPTLYNPAGVE